MTCHRFIRRSLDEALSFMRESLASDACAARPGFLQARDARLKTAGVAIVLLAVLLARSPAAVANLYLLCLAVACGSAIRPGYFLKRTWLFIPLFALAIAVPALFSAFSPGEPVAALPFFGRSLVITRQGVGAATLFFLRVLTSVSWAVLLALTTKHHELLKVLRMCRVPPIFIMTIGMCRRYIFLLVDILQNTFLAIRSRTGFTASAAEGQRLVGWNMAALWLRSYHLHRQVHAAMVSRGYDGEPRTLDAFRVGWKDLVWVGTTLMFFSVTLWTTRFSP